jgi:flagellar basal-body rod protein FlgB
VKAREGRFEMSGLNIFGSQWMQIENALYARESVQKSIATNVANAETPGFQKDTSSFESLFAQHSGKNSSMAVTHSSHLNSEDSSRALFDQPLSHAKNGINNVDIQDEMRRMAENQMMHELTTQLISKKLTGIKDTIQQAR